MLSLSYKKLLRGVKNFFHKVEGYIFALLYGFPARKLKVIGITGTDGKTTTVNLIYHCLTQAGKKAIVVSSVYAKIGDLEYDTGLHTTTPSASKMQFFLKKAVDSGCDYAVLEITAHGIDQNREAAIDFHISGITNITPEHIISKDKESDYFGTFENYRDTKIKLLEKSSIAVVNKDDANFEYIAEKLRGKKFFTYSIKQQADFKVDFKRIGLDDLPDFWKEDFSLAYAILRLLGLPDHQIFAGFKSFKTVPGRMEVIWDKGVTAIIDFAHTQNSFKKVLPYVKNKFAKDSRLIHIFGTAGQRDFQKRPFMGQYSAENSDIIILTEEDYRNEDINKIFDEIEKGIKKYDFKLIKPEEIDKYKDKRRFYLRIPDRREAIKTAIEISKKGDVILMTGKSHEKSLARGNKEYPWNEKETALEFLKKKYA